LLNNSENTLPVHWSFTVRNGSLSPPAYTDAGHRNLLTTTAPGLFLITEEAGMPTIPTPGGGLYYASISATKTSFAITRCPQGGATNPCAV